MPLPLRPIHRLSTPVAAACAGGTGHIPAARCPFSFRSSTRERTLLSRHYFQNNFHALKKFFHALKIFCHALKIIFHALKKYFHVGEIFRQSIYFSRETGAFRQGRIPHDEEGCTYFQPAMCEASCCISSPRLLFATQPAGGKVVILLTCT